MDFVSNQARSAGSQSTFYAMCVKHVLHTRTCKHVLHTRHFNRFTFTTFGMYLGSHQKTKGGKVDHALNVAHLHGSHAWQSFYAMVTPFASW